jgi:hypothetical protein
MFKNDSLVTLTRMTLGLLPAGGEYIVTITKANNFTSIRINSKSFRNASIGVRGRRCVMQKPETKSPRTVSLKGLSHQIFKSFLSSTILNQYFLYER